MWTSFETPTNEKLIIGCWYAAIYIGKKSNETALYIGLAQRRCLQDENGPTSALELDCLQRKLGISDDILESHKNGKHDIYICATENIVLGPLKVSYTNNGKHSVAGYSEARKFFEMAKKLDRVDIRRKYLCECFKQ